MGISNKIIKKHAVHTVHRLALVPYVRGTPRQLPSISMRQDGTWCDHPTSSTYGLLQLVL